MSITRDIARYIIEASFDDIPERAINKTKELILDDIGNALGGSLFHPSRIIIEWGKKLGGVCESSIVSDGTKVPAGIAAGVNTQLSMALEFSETYENKDHPGSNIVMAALALGERERSSGKEVLTAVCAAYDVTCRIVDATFPSPEFRRRVWNQSMQGCGPVVVGIKLLKLNKEEAMNAFGMGLGNAPTMNVHNIAYVPASMSKLGNQFHNFVAINAVILAQLGYTGYYEIFDDPYAYWTTISDQNDRDAYTADLGKRFIIATSMSFKPWPTCRWAQPGIDSLLNIMQSECLNPLDIEEVIYHSHEKITNFPYDNIDPQTTVDAYWSVPWAFGNAALGYRPGPLWYADERLRDKQLKSFMKKVKLKTLPEAVEAFATEPSKSVTLLEVKSTSSKVYSKKTEYCKGDPQKALTHEEVVDKFIGQTEGVISTEKAHRLIDLVERLEELEDISDIIPFLY